jgi:hypothetical protein
MIFRSCFACLLSVALLSDGGKMAIAGFTRVQFRSAGDKGPRSLRPSSMAFSFYRPAMRGIRQSYFVAAVV